MTTRVSTVIVELVVDPPPVLRVSTVIVEVVVDPPPPIVPPSGGFYGNFPSQQGAIGSDFRVTAPLEVS